MNLTATTAVDTNSAVTLELEQAEKLLVAVKYVVEDLRTKQMRSKREVKSFSREVLCDESCDTENVALPDQVYLQKLSYRLRAALTPVLGWSHMLVAEETGAVTKPEALSSILRNAELLLKIVEELESDFPLRAKASTFSSSNSIHTTAD